MHFGVDNMTKKRIWNLSCAVLMFLLICTVLSIRIEKLMQMEVKTSRGTMRQGKEVREILLPVSAVIRSKVGDSAVQYVQKEKGIFGNTVWRVVNRPVICLGEEKGYAVVPEANVTEGTSVVDIIYYSTDSVRENELVTVTPASVEQGGVLIYAPGAVTAEEVAELDKKDWVVETAGTGENDLEADWLLVRKSSGEQIYFRTVSDIFAPLFGKSVEGQCLDLSAHYKMLSQIRRLMVLVALIPAGMICLSVIWRLLGRLQQRDFRKGLAGVLLFVVFLVVLYVLTGIIEVPRQFLPGRQLFDVRHYIEGIHHFFSGMGEAWQHQELYLELREQYTTALVLYSALAVVVWIATFSLLVWRRRNKKRREL